MADFITKERAEVAEEPPRHGFSGREKQAHHRHKVTLSNMAAEEGSIGLTQQLRRQIGD